MAAEVACIVHVIVAVLRRAGWGRRVGGRRLMVGARWWCNLAARRWSVQVWRR